MTHTHRTYKAAVLQTGAHRALRNHVVETLASFNLTVPEWTIIGHIHNSDSLRFVDIAQLLAVEPPHVTTLIDLLQKKKLVQRKDDPNDRRAKRIVLTKKAEDLVPEVEIELSARMNLLLENISPEEMTVYFKVLESIINNDQKLAQQKANSSVTQSESSTTLSSKT